MRTSQNRLIPLCVAAFCGILISYLALSTRISKTGWENFPESMFDWLSIISTTGIFSFLLYLLVHYLKGNQSQDSSS